MAKASQLTSGPADAEIVRLIKASDEAGLRALLKVHGLAVLEILTRKHGSHVANDAINRAALLIWMEMGSKYQDGKGTLRGWFLQIAHRKAIDIRRGEKLGRFTQFDVEPGYDPTECDDKNYQEEKRENVQRREQRNEALRQFIGSLPRVERIVTECDRDGVHDIAEINVIRIALANPTASNGSVDTARCKARRKIRAEMERLGYFPTKPGGATMAEESDKFWKLAKGKLRRAANLDPMCREEAEEEVKRTKSRGPMADEDVNSIMNFVRSIGERGGLPVQPDGAATEEVDEDQSDGWVDPVSAEMMDEQILQLNSNAGERDLEAEALLEKLRREALGDDAVKDKRDIQDTPRLGDGKDVDGAGGGGG